MKGVLQAIMAMLFFLIFTFCAWYEGSEILDNPWEWEYTTPFSELVHTQVEGPEDISSLDHLVYAAKFRPLFPALMMMTLLYLVTLTGLTVSEGSRKKSAFFLTGLGTLLLLMSGLIWSSPTVGGHFFKGISLIFGIVAILVGMLYYVKWTPLSKRVA
ncbi:YjdJ family protein [Peribacillus sp. NPDC097264]|uniref:YjdJ family protein n=1 Tax=Peribacillus sp. NPDC097264 TaxID=3390616 RepID=UPI003CFDEA9F